MTTITREQAQKIIDAADEVITALAGTNDDFHPDNSEKMCGLWDDLNDRYAPPEVVRELARAMLASMDAEPAGYHVIKECGKIGCSVATLEEAEKTRDFWNKKWIIKPYFHSAPPASERERIRREHAEWSDDSFGDVGSVGPLKHLSKEAIEAAAEPDDLSEWADMQFLLWDAQRRAGISDGEITAAMVKKLEINKSRQWPEPKDGEPRLHIKEQPVPVVRQIMRELVSLLDEDQFARIENIALSAGVMPPQPVPVVPEEMPKGLAGQIVSLLAHNIGDKFLAQKIWNACRAAILQSKYRDLSQPVDPQVTEYEQIMLRAGWVMVPVEPTDEMIAAAMECDDVVFDSKDPTAFCVQFREIYYAMVDAAPKQEGNNG